MDFHDRELPEICQLLFKSNNSVCAEQTVQSLHQEILWTVEVQEAITTTTA